MTPRTAAGRVKYMRVSECEEALAAAREQIEMLQGHVETLLSFVEQYARNGDYEGANAALEARAALATFSERRKVTT